MLDPRIYRTSLVLVALAAFVLAFSLQNQPGALSTTLPPDAFNGAATHQVMTGLASSYPDRRPGTAGDDALGDYVAQRLRADGFLVGRDTFTAATAPGRRTLETVTGTRPGLHSGSIVIAASRDSSGGGWSGLSGTAVLLELAQVLSGQTQHRSLVLASTSGSVGAAGASHLAASLGRSADAVVVLGDVAQARLRQPVVVPWSAGSALAPTLLRNTVAAAVRTQAQLPVRDPSLVDQLAHLTLPVAVTEQAPFAARATPAVTLSFSGDRQSDGGTAPSPARLAGIGRALLASIGALDTGPAVPAPSSYLIVQGKVIPGWAIRLFVLALLAPLVFTTLDAVARVRRRGHALRLGLVWVLGCAAPFLAAVAAARLERLVGILPGAPAGDVGAGAIPLHGLSVVGLALVACVLALGLVLLRPLGARLVPTAPAAPRSPRSPRRPETGPAGRAGALLLVMCTLGLLVWLRDPLAAGLIAIALHLWLWILDPEVRLPRVALAILALAGLVPLALTILYHAADLGLGPVGLAWSVLLAVSGGLGWTAVAAWSVGLGCAVSALWLAAHRAAKDAESQAVTVRGPVTYAGPGSLGATKSSLRRLRT